MSKLNEFGSCTLIRKYIEFSNDRAVENGYIQTFAPQLIMMVNEIIYGARNWFKFVILP